MLKNLYWIQLVLNLVSLVQKPSTLIPKSPGSLHLFYLLLFTSLLRTIFHHQKKRTEGCLKIKLLYNTWCYDYIYPNCMHFDYSTWEDTKRDLSPYKRWYSNITNNWSFRGSDCDSDYCSVAAKFREQLPVK